MRKNPDWGCVTRGADWAARDSHGALVHDDHLWVLGGWYSPQTPNPRDVWKSADGLRWTRTVEAAPWEFSDGIRMAGGHAEPLGNEVRRLEIPEEWFMSEGDT